MSSCRVVCLALVNIKNSNIVIYLYKFRRNHWLTDIIYEIGPASQCLISFELILEPNVDLKLLDKFDKSLFGVNPAILNHAFTKLFTLFIALQYFCSLRWLPFYWFYTFNIETKLCFEPFYERWYAGAGFTRKACKVHLV